MELRSGERRKKEVVDLKSKTERVYASSSQEESVYETLLTLGDTDLVPNNEIFHCPVCVKEVEPGNGVTIHDCLHSVCKDCLASSVEFSETAMVKCPFRNEEYSCESYLQEREIKSLVTEEVYEQHLQLGILLAESEADNSFHCKTPNCLGWCFVEDSVSTFLCPVCNCVNCLKCSAIQVWEDCKCDQDEVIVLGSVSEEGQTKENSQDVTNDEQHSQLEIALAESVSQESLPNRFRCKTPDCPGWCFVEDNATTFLCPVCKFGNCLKCLAFHKENDCKQNKDEVIFLFESTTDEKKESSQAHLPQPACKKRRKKEICASTSKKVCTSPSEGLSFYHTLIALDESKLVPNAEGFECPVCFGEISAGEGVTLQECLHSFCKDCLARAVEFSETPEVKCPFMNEEYSCESHLQEKEVKCLVPPDIYERHLQRSVSLAENQAEDSFHCKTPDCPGWVFFEDNVYTFRCPVCNHVNCLTCAAIHEGKNCQQYQDEITFLSDTSQEAMKTKTYLQSMLDKSKAMKCPKCQIILVKNGGCDALQCSMCKTEICWVTRGPRWGPAGRGDTSGGCRCLVNGKRCHKKCGDCH